MAGGCAGVAGSKLAVAFACVIGAGMASVIGALCMIILPIKNTLFLAAALAFAAGVMFYISLVDIYAGKAIGHFEDAGYSPAYAFTYASICFFCGFPISWGLDKLAERLIYQGAEDKAFAAPFHVPTATPAKTVLDNKTSSIDPSPTLPAAMSTARTVTDVDAESGLQRVADASNVEYELQRKAADNEEAVKLESSKKLLHLGLLAAMAMALHNMPEGLVTFVGYMDSVTSGITTAVAIAIHNIPEGMVIASAVYFGTGLRWKAMQWTLLAASAEPLGGLIGLAVVCGGSMTNTVFGILFGLVGGIMVYISLKELLPSARRFDPDDRVTTAFMTVGMIVMSCSLVAIGFSQPVVVPEVAVVTSDGA